MQRTVDGRHGSRFAVARAMRSMRPSFAARIGKIVGIRHARLYRRPRLEHLVGDAFALAKRRGFLFGVERQTYLLSHVAGTGPAPQRFDRARLLGLVVERPFLGLGLARLSGRARGLVNAGGPFVRTQFSIDANSQSFLHVVELSLRRE